MTSSAGDTSGGAAEIIVSADSHVLEPGDLWAERVDTRYRDRVPRIFYDEAASKYKFGGGGIPIVNYSGLFAANKRDDELAAHNTKALAEADAPAGGWDPAARLAAQDVDGVSAEVLYASLAFPMFRVEDLAYQAALFRAYNDWLSEFCSYDTNRLVGMGLAGILDVDGAIAELERTRDRGLRGVMVMASPPADRPFTGRSYDRFWAAAQDLDMPVGLHILTGHGRPSKQMLTDLPANEYFGGLMELHEEVVHSLTDIVFSGVLERFPRLKIVSAENEIGWIGFWLHMADLWWNRYRASFDTELTMAPSGYYKRQIYATFLEDPIGIHDAALPLMGYGNLMWGNDYPHGSSTWPNSRQVIDTVLAGVPAEARAAIVRDTCVELFGLKLPESPEAQRSAATTTL